MYSTTDPGLPFGQDNLGCRGGYRILSKPKPNRGLSGIEIDIIEIKDQVRKVYRDFILNW